MVRVIDLKFYIMNLSENIKYEHKWNKTIARTISTWHNYVKVLLVLFVKSLAY